MPKPRHSVTWQSDNSKTEELYQKHDVGRFNLLLRVINMDFILPFDEKRKFPRVKVNSPITLEDQDSGKTYTGHCLDLSTTGSRIVIEEETLAENTLLRIKLASPLGLDPFCALARVVYHCADNNHELGLEITEILSPD